MFTFCDVLHEIKQKRIVQYRLGIICKLRIKNYFLSFRQLMHIQICLFLDLKLNFLSLVSNEHFPMKSENAKISWKTNNFWLLKSKRSVLFILIIKNS